MNDFHPVSAADRADNLRAELERLRARRASVVSTFARDESTGDAADQAGTVERASELALLDQRIEAITDALDQTSSRAAGAVPPGEVGIGRVVSLDFGDGDEERLLVGPVELDDGDARVITPESPLGRALLGKRAGESVEYQTPAGPARATIVNVDA